MWGGSSAQEATEFLYGAPEHPVREVASCCPSPCDVWFSVSFIHRWQWGLSGHFTSLHFCTWGWNKTAWPQGVSEGDLECPEGGSPAPRPPRSRAGPGWPGAGSRAHAPQAPAAAPRSPAGPDPLVPSTALARHIADFSAGTSTGRCRRPPERGRGCTEGAVRARPLRAAGADRGGSCGGGACARLLLSLRLVFCLGLHPVAAAAAPGTSEPRRRRILIELNVQCPIPLSDVSEGGAECSSPWLLDLSGDQPPPEAV